MLDGKKHLAVFNDALFNGAVSETIIPEQAFAPYVRQGTIIRFARERKSDGHIIRHVCFTLPGHEWRADAFFWMHNECIAGRRPFDDAYEFFVGRLLGYEESDIRHFIEHRNQMAPARTGT